MTRSIVDTLRHLNGGVFIDETSDALAEVVRAVDLSGKAGSVTIKIDIRRATAGAMALRERLVAFEKYRIAREMQAAA